MPARQSERIYAALARRVARRRMLAGDQAGNTRRKVGAAIVAVRRGGAIHAYDTINHFFLGGEMVVPGSVYWNVGIGREIGQVRQDDEGMATMTNLGQNIAWLLGKLNAGVFIAAIVVLKTTRIGLPPPEISLRRGMRRRHSP